MSAFLFARLPRRAFFLLAFSLVLVVSALVPSTARAQGQRKPRPDISALLPNPYNPARGPLRVAYFLPASMDLTIEVFTIDGRLVTSLVNDNRSGNNEVSWDGRWSDGTIASNGIYIVRLAVGKSVVSKNVVLLAQ